MVRGAVHDDVDLVVALGGDGTVNEVANGLAGSNVPLGILPGGGANVFARSLGIPNDPVEATALLIEHADRAPRRIPLGLCDDRHFLFACGVGLDAAIVEAVERRRALKRSIGQGYYVWSGLRVVAGSDRRRPHVTVRWGAELEHRRERLFLAIAQNCSPFTYFGGRQSRLCPRVRLEGGLDLFAVDTMRPQTLVRIFAQTFGSGSHIRHKRALYLHDETRIEITCDEPMAVQMDGEFVGRRRRLELRSVPNALSLLY